jgi:cell division septation protein DedD
MHKWKDKVELSLDNRQIFFLFFGLSVVGCFVFALGVMVGRRVSFDPAGEVAALSADSLSLLEGEGEQEAELSFKDGLKEPATEDVPPTRDPNAPPAADAAADADAPAPAPKKKSDAEPVLAAAKKPAAKPAAEQAEAPKKPAAKPAKASSDAPPAPVGQKYTLQMKAFSKQEEADSFAAKLKENGHDARVESHEVKGRLWHRVRVGTFDNWADGLEAKEEFEASEKIIAYVVRL